MSMETVERDGEVLWRFRAGPSSFLLLPERGARWMRWDLSVRGRPDRPVLHWPETFDWLGLERLRGGNPVLFPFAARTFADARDGYWRDPSGKVRPMPRHGFCRDGRFEVEASSDGDGCVCRFLPRDEDFEAYPFEYVFRVRFRFAPLGATIVYELENRDKVPIPWAAGHHFYFTLPWHAGLTRRDYLFCSEAKKAFRHEPNGDLTAVERPDPAHRMDDPALVDTIFTRLKHPEVRFGPEGGEEWLGIRMFGNEGAGDAAWWSVVLWTESPESPFYCVEPWMAPPNAPAHRKGLAWVAPGAVSQFGVELSLL